MCLFEPARVADGGSGIKVAWTPAGVVNKHSRVSWQIAIRGRHHALFLINGGRSRVNDPFVSPGVGCSQKNCKRYKYLKCLRTLTSPLPLKFPPQRSAIIINDILIVNTRVISPQPGTRAVIYCTNSAFVYSLPTWWTLENYSRAVLLWQ